MNRIEKSKIEAEDDMLNDALVESFVNRDSNRLIVKVEKIVLAKRMRQIEIMADILKKEFKIDLHKVASTYEIYKNCISNTANSMQK